MEKLGGRNPDHSSIYHVLYVNTVIVQRAFTDSVPILGHNSEGTKHFKSLCTVKAGLLEHC